MNSYFRNVSKIYFPQAEVVADKNHVIRQFYWAMENVRKNEQKNCLFISENTSSIPVPCGKTTGKIDTPRHGWLALILEIAPRVADAYRLKDDFLAVMCSGSSLDGQERLKGCSRWI